MPSRRGPLLNYLKVQELFERELLFTLKRTSAAIDRDLRQWATKEGPGAIVRRAQLRAAQRAINLRLADLWKAVGSQVRSQRLLAAAAASDTMFEYEEVLLRAKLTKEEREILKRSLAAQSERNIENAISRMQLSQIPLSDRVYKSRVLISGQMDRIINNALARGRSAAELAAEVRGFIRPDTPGGVRYAAQRLGRTELNNAFHATQVQRGVDSPFILAQQWVLSSSHPKPDDCNNFADDNHEGMGAGVFSPQNVPGKPHPQCLCYMVPVTPEPRDFSRLFNAGVYDSWLDAHV
jgi:hypothetical protein